MSLNSKTQESSPQSIIMRPKKSSRANMYPAVHQLEATHNYSYDKGLTNSSSKQDLIFAIQADPSGRVRASMDEPKTNVL